MRNNQKNYNKTPQNPFGQQTTPPSFANNQRGPKKSHLELLLENFVMGQTKQNQEFKNQTGFLNDSLIKLTSKVNSIVTHNKMLETQISQVAQQVASSSQTPRIFPGQPETNPKTHFNVVTLRNGRQLEEPQVKDKAKESEKVSNKPQSEEAEVESEKPKTPPPYKPKIPFPQRLAKANLDAKFKKFVDMLKEIYINVPFTEALSKMPLYAKKIERYFIKENKNKG